LYANPGHTAASGDDLDGELVVQWFGEPGPREMIDRHHRAMSPLVAQGRIIIAADNRVIAVNQYNGSPL
ncbi:MAG TPA: hypothetical protein DCM87_05330, partial [Planctomycetes bacterium]|nr:hypothetical protein [Planctomycetota bacterium]